MNSYVSSNTPDHTSPVSWVAQYQDWGLSPHGLPLNSKGKGGLPDGWTEGDHSNTVKDGMNVGCRLNDLVDVDVDLHSGGPFMHLLLPSKCMFGRQSAKMTHHIYNVEGPGAEYIKLKVTDAFAAKYLNGKNTVLEIRTGSGYQTVLPPSVHQSNESVRFEPFNGRVFDGTPSTYTFKEIRKCAIITAFAAVLEYILPGKGARQDAILSAAGVMKKYLHVEKSDCERILLCLAKETGDDEIASRRAAVAATYKDNKQGKQLSGWKKFQQAFLLEDADIKQFQSWVKVEKDYEDEVALLDSTYKLVVDAGTAYWSERRDLETGRLEWIRHTQTDIQLAHNKSPAVERFFKTPKTVYGGGFYFDPTTTEWKDGGINLWRGWSIAPKEGPWPTIEHHMREVLCESNDRYYQYVFKWFAFYVQHPDKQAEVALAFVGEKGTGKGKFLNALGNLAKEHYMHVDRPGQLVGRFNGHFANCVFVFADEVVGKGMADGDSALKSMITEPTLPIEDKGAKIRSIVNRLHIVISANDDWSIPATPGERRFGAFAVSSKFMGNRAYFGKLTEALEGEEMRAFFYALKNHDISNWHPRDDVPETKLLQVQKALTGARGPEGLLRRWLEEGCLPGTHADFDLANVVAVDFALMDANGRINPTVLGKYLLKFADSRRDRRPLHSSISGKDASRQVTVYEFPSLAETRQKFDPKADWSAFPSEWEHEYSEGAPGLVDPTKPDMVIQKPMDEEAPF